MRVPIPNLLSLVVSFVLLALFVSACDIPRARADGPRDNDPKLVRRVPPQGIAVDPTILAELADDAKRLWEATLRWDESDVDSVSLGRVIPRAVLISLETEMVYSKKDLENIRTLLVEGERRLERWNQGKRGRQLMFDAETETESPRLVVGGFRSRIDGSIQPYGLELPAGWDPTSDTKLRMDVWLHGRGEKVSEAAFLTQRLRRPSEYAPENTVVLHPYGRYSNAFKFAGEIDVLEAMEHVQSLFNVDRQRIAIRGFSMGGAGCWQLAVHYPDLWAAANPGAGFCETMEFLRFFQQEEFQPTWYQRRLLHWYDCPDWTNNLRHVPTVAYSGELDRQKQAAEVMVAAAKARQLDLPHVIGPQTGHKIHTDSKLEIQRMLTEHLDLGKPALLKDIDLTTYSLRYHQLGWIRIEGLQEHWRESRVRAKLEMGELGDRIELAPSGISRLAIHLPSSTRGQRLVTLEIENTLVEFQTKSDGSLSVNLVNDNAGTWVESKSDIGLRKRPGLQGPIDDAFMDAFLFVGPDAGSQEVDGASPVDRWVANELVHAKSEWRRHFRGDVVEKSAESIAEADWKNRNLVLFGTPRTNSLIRRIVEQLPLAWDSKRVRIGDAEFDAQHHVPLLIYPNPLNPHRYVVLNSGVTYREYAYLNNARQIPMLPDWAIVDVSQGATTQFPGRVAKADFFDESWQVKLRP